MTWRPSAFLLEGELDNRTPGKITGWLRFAGLAAKVTLDLEGDFDPDIRGKRISLRSAYNGDKAAAAKYMEGFYPCQTGQAGHITAGLPPQVWFDFPYVEWDSAANDRVVLYLEPHQVAVLEDTAESVAVEPGSG